MRSDIATRKQLTSHAKSILKHKPEKIYIDLAEISFAEYIEYHLCPDLIDEIEQLKEVVRTQKSLTELAIKQLTNYGLTQLEINLNSMLEKLDSDYLD